MANQNDAVMQFVQDLAKTLQADPNEVIQVAQQNPEALKSAVEVFQQTQDIQQAAQAFQQSLQQQVQVAKHGAKLQYLKSLKNKCAEDEKLYYFKKGGSVGCGCKKKEEGGKVTKTSSVDKFKNRKQDQATKDSIEVNVYGNDDIPNKNPGDFKRNKQGKVQWTPDRTKTPYNKVTRAQKGYKSTFTKSADGRDVLEERVEGKDTMYVTRNPKYGVVSSSGNRFKDKQSRLEFESDRYYFNYSKQKNSKKTSKDLVKKDSKGSKMKLLERGSKCPKCGKVHSAGMGCSIAEFKKKFEKGGLLKLQRGSTLPTAPKAEDRFRNGIKKSYQTKGYETKSVVGEHSNLLKTPAVITRTVRYSNVSPEYNDTIYSETPERLIMRGAHSRGASRIQIPFVGTMYGDGYMMDLNKNNASKSEYETLKRRFNTAWNLAK